MAGSSAGARATGLLAAIERRLGLTPAGVAVTALVVPGLALGRAVASRPLFLLAYGALAVVGLSRLLARRRLTVDAFRSALPTRMRASQSVEVEISVTAKRRIATLVLEESLPEPFGAPVRVPVPLLPAGKTVQHGYRFTARRRGVYRVGPLLAEWSDPFGLTRKRVEIAPAETVIVHPAVEDANDRVTSREWEDPPVRPPQSRPWPSGFEFYGMRDYIAGDDPRRINWLATARTGGAADGSGRYLVRESEQGITDRVRLVLDTDAARHSPGEPSETLERAISVMASLGVRHLADGFSVSVEAGSGALAKALRGSRSRIPLLDCLAAVELQAAPLAGALDRLFLDPQRSTHNVVVTPHVDEETARRIKLLMARGTSVVLVLVLWEDTEPSTVHRAASIGCPVVELKPGASLAATFSRVVQAGSR
ncbi:MAG TPA: DUF58 domain-containing protein [Acidimicrobiales bacterium]|nr:DUF58 domain-containing protein [Acidimicrobiales bacterium]